MCIEESVDTSKDGWYWSEQENGWTLFVGEHHGVLFVANEILHVFTKEKRDQIEKQLPAHLRPAIIWVPRLTDPMVADGYRPLWPIVKGQSNILDGIISLNKVQKDGGNV